MDVFEKDVLEYIRKYHMFDGISHCVCGVSGGADSVSLLTVLAAQGGAGNRYTRCTHKSHDTR